HRKRDSGCERRSTDARQPRSCLLGWRSLCESAAARKRTSALVLRMSLPLFPESAPGQLSAPIASFLDRLPAAWKTVLSEVWQDPRWNQLIERIEQRRQAGAVIYPPDPFRVFSLLLPQ